MSGCSCVDDGRTCRKVAGHKGACRFVGVRASTKAARSTVVSDGHDVGKVALIMNVLSAAAALGGDVGLVLWVADHPDGEFAFRAWAMANAHSCYMREHGVSIDLRNRATCELIATFRIDMPRHQAHPLAPRALEAA